MKTTALFLSPIALVTLNDMKALPIPMRINNMEANPKSELGRPTSAYLTCAMNTVMLWPVAAIKAQAIMTGTNFGSNLKLP